MWLVIFLIEGLSNDFEILEKFNLGSIIFKVVYGDIDFIFVLFIFNYNEIFNEIDILK